jgi:7 transmembrane sweet-taste receptor of 3 GCPR
MQLLSYSFVDSQQGEIAAPAGTDLSGWSIVLYESTNGEGTVYNSTTIPANTIITNQSNGFGFLSFLFPNIEDGIGSGSGVALLDSTFAVRQFLSYEGTFTAVDGPANGTTTNDIGVQEPNNSPTTSSLQLSGTGHCYENFVWQNLAPSTPGNLNNNQTFTPPRRVLEEFYVTTVRPKQDDAASLSLHLRLRNLQQRNGRKLPSYGSTERGTLVAGVLDSYFHGASGQVKFGLERTNERDAEDISVGIYNIRPGSTDTSNGKRSYTSTLVAMYQQDVGWKDIAGSRIYYRDGSAVASEVLREFSDLHFITPAIRDLGLVLMFIAWIIGALGLVALWIFRKDSIIVRAQPVLMRVVCIASIVMSTSIFTLSWDEGAGWNQRQLDACCVLTPLFFFIGHTLTLCSLFSKLWRIHSVFLVRRQAVAVNRVLVPSLALLALTVVVLAVWTALDPWNWHRVLIRQIPAESYASCTSNDLWAYISPLSGIIFFGEAITLYFAWKTSDAPEEYGDTTSIMYACFTHMQTWAIGGPMLVVLESSSTDAVYFARVILIWIFSCSTVLVVIVPKVTRACLDRRDPGTHPQTLRVAVAGIADSRNQKYTMASYAEIYRDDAASSTAFSRLCD